MEKIELNEREKTLLKSIMEDKYSRGAFTGMCFNAFISRDCEMSMSMCIKFALQMRLLAEDLVR